MAPSFGRSISFPLSPARTSRARAAAYHVRSASLPCHSHHHYSSHPLLARLSSHIAAVRSWAADPAGASPATGLAHLAALHAALADLLLLPEAQPALLHGSSSSSASGLLDAFLLLADAHQGFQESLLGLKSHAADAQAALRRRDAARLASALRSSRRAEKDLARLAASARAAACKFPSSSAAEIPGAIADAVLAAATASAAVFSAVECLSAATATAVASKKSTASSSFMALVKRSSKTASACSDADDEEKEMAALEKLEACAAEMESGSDTVFRAILRTRVALLNIQTQTCC